MKADVRVNAEKESLLFRAMDCSVELSRRAVRADGEPKDDRIPIAISSETPCERMDYWKGETYQEILDHSAIDLSYARDGLPFLVDHSTRDMVGIVEDIAVDEDKKIRGRVRFSRSVRAQEIRQDMLDGIRKKISVGYRQSEEYDQTEDNGAKVRRYKNWMPMEASSVPIPADYEVGVGRSATPADPTVGVGRSAGFPLSTPPPTTHRHMTTPATEHPPADLAVRALSDERSRAAEITSLAAEHGVSDRVPEWVRTGTSVADVRAQILQHVRRSIGQPTSAGSGTGPLGPDWSPRERDRYSIVRAIGYAAGDNVEGGFEREISREIARMSRRDTPGVFIPYSALLPLSQRATLTSTGVGTGKETVYTEMGEFIDMLRNKMLSVFLGARALPGLQGNVALPRQTGTGGATWMAEAPGAGVAATNLTLEQVTLTPKTLQSTTQLSRQLMIQSTPAIEELIRADLFDAHAVAIDLAVLAGTGAANQPTGILNAAGVNVVAMAANGAIPNLAKLLEAEKVVEDANAAAPNAAYLTTPGQRSKMREIQRFAGTDGSALWTDEGKILSTRAFATKQMPSDLTKGTAVGICHALIYGDFSQILIGQWGPGFELIVDPYTLATRNMVQITSYQTADVAVRRPAAFSVIKDLLV